MKFINFFQFVYDIFTHLDPDPVLDQQHCRKEMLIVKG
jgi:hypothetical protein